jgi:hypothetical protein
MKNKETLEEAAKEYAENEIKDRGTDNDKLICSIDFIAGAKWQAERMYSEEDMRKAFSYYSQRLILGYEYIDVYFKEWMIEQFKK